MKLNIANLVNVANLVYNARVHKEKTLLTAGLLLSMLFLGVADAALLEGGPIATPPDTDIDTPVTDIANPTDTAPDDTAPKPPEGGVSKNDGPDILTTLIGHGFTFGDTPESERIVLSRIVPAGEAVTEQRVLMHKGDRAGSIAWVSSPNVKRYYLSLKDLLHVSFTPKVRDLVDETQRRENRPTRNLLTFMDEGLLPERVVFVRVRERLFELHIAEGKSESIFDLIEDLTQ